VGEKGRAAMLVTPADTVDENRESLQWQVAVEQDGAARITGLWTLTGAPASDFREELAQTSPYERRQWLERTLASQLSGVRLDTFSIGGMIPEEGALKIAYTFGAQSFGTFADSSLLVRPGRFAMSALPDYFRATAREHPVQLRYGHRRDLRMRIALPREYRRVRPSGADSVGSGFGWARTRLSLDGRQLYFEGSYRVSGAPVQPASYAAFQAFLDAMRTQDEREVVLSP
jgi:hypothetical protein